MKRTPHKHALVHLALAHHRTKEASRTREPPKLREHFSKDRVYRHIERRMRARNVLDELYSDLEEAKQLLASYADTASEERVARIKQRIAALEEKIREIEEKKWQ